MFVMQNPIEYTPLHPAITSAIVPHTNGTR